MDQEAAVSLLQAATLIKGTVFNCIDRKRFPFTKTQLSIFTVLDMEGELTMKQIARYLASSQEQATRAVAPLADAGYVERRTDPANRTRVHIHLTDSGKQLFGACRLQLIETLSVKTRQALNEEELAALNDAANTVTRLLEKIE